MKLILVFDRGYVRVALIKDLNGGRQPYLIRGRSNMIVQAEVRGRRQRISLGRLPPSLRPGRTLGKRYFHFIVITEFVNVND